MKPKIQIIDIREKINVLLQIIYNLFHIRQLCMNFIITYNIDKYRFSNYKPRKVLIFFTILIISFE